MPLWLHSFESLIVDPSVTESNSIVLLHLLRHFVGLLAVKIPELVQLNIHVVNFDWASESKKIIQNMDSNKRKV